MKEFLDMGDAPQLPHPGSHHGSQRQPLPLHEPRLHQRLQLTAEKNCHCAAPL